MTYTAIPTVDFADYSNKYSTIAEQVLEACKTIGFFYIINHSIPSSQVAKIFELSRDFFELPTEDKVKHAKVDKEYQGYLSLYSQRLDPKNQKQGDNKESYDFLHFVDNQNRDDRMPPVFLEHKDNIAVFTKNLHSTVMQVFELLAAALKLPKGENGKDNWLSQRHQYGRPFGTGITRVQRYPSNNPTKHRDTVQLGAHTDYTTITLLFQRDVGGLEVKAADDTWISVPVREDAVLVNVGGMLEYWSCGLLKGAMHRVVFAPEQQGRDRYSVVYFSQPESGTKLTNMPSPAVPKERPTLGDVPNNVDITSDDYLEYRYRRSFYEAQSADGDGDTETK
ncbi:hypothetical protein BJV82DRAFT_670060 [Fennellomyces sp. T-0311]|nr:hypothetical protein BJV82DRAFT_670060 [Fennellomyces sp. T-0311]